MCVASHVRRVRTLYKSILKLHRGLPVEVQELGNNYAKGIKLLVKLFRHVEIINNILLFIFR